MPQGTVRSYDSHTKTGVIVADDGSTTWEIDPPAIEYGIFRFLRPGQRVTFDLDTNNKPRDLRIGVA